MRNPGWICSIAIKLFLLFLPFVGMSQTWGPKYVSMTYGSGGYYEYLPVGYNDPANANKRYPVILFIQGIGDMGNGTTELNLVRRTGFPTVINAGLFPDVFTVNGEQFSFIAIVPQFSNWPEPGQIHNILNFIEANYRADASRLYLTGLSMGGGATWDYAGASLANANRLAAILPVCGASSPNTSRMQNIANANLPVLATHNDLDPTVTVWNTIGYVDGINSYNPNPSAIKLIWQAALHNSWTRTYDPAEKLVGNLNAYEWMLQYKRGAAGPPPPTPLSASISASTMVSCFGGANGSATARGNGGTGPYTYSWNTSPAQTAATANNLAAGTYTVTVRDAVGATATAAVTITQPAQLNLSVTPGTITNKGGSTNVTLSASGGTAPYTFTGPTTNVVAGTYSYVVTDSKGCTASRTVTITEPATAIPVSAALETWKDVTCAGGNNGSAEVRVLAGLPPYTYAWNTAPVQTTAVATNLKAGVYVVTIRDANNTTTTVSATIVEPSPLNLTVTPGVIATAGGSTSVALSAAGGTAPYTFTGPTVNVRAGTYNYVVTDAKGCTANRTVTITEPSAVVPVSATLENWKNVSCAGGSDGSAEVRVTAGLAPYTYTWNTVPAQTTAVATNLKAGVYLVTVRDANNTTTTVTATIVEPSPINLSVSPGVISTPGGSTSVTVSASGGTAPYVFTGPTTNVSAGTYTYTVTDAKGCVSSRSITINEPTAVPSVKVLVETWKNVSCAGGSDGSAEVKIAAGVAPFTYSWNTVPVQNTPVATNLRAGTYTVTVRDANNSTDQVTVSIVEPLPLRLDVIAGTISIFGGNTSVSLGASGGTSPYTFTGQTSAVRAGTYTYTVTDAKGCTDTKSVTLTEPAPVPVSIEVSSIRNVSCFNGANGSATARVNSGTPPYTYSWSSSPVQTGAVANGLRAGNYSLTVRDANGLSATANFSISEPAPLQLAVTPGNITTYNGTTTVGLQANGGTQPYSFSGGPTVNVTAGTYGYQVSDGNGCVKDTTITINQPAPPPTASVLILSGNSTQVTCNGSSDGSATVSPENGTAPYTYTWNTVPAQTTQTAVGLKAGTYAVTVRDANGVSGNISLTVLQPSELTLQISAGTINTFGGTTSVSLTASGGTAPYRFSGVTENLAAGTYTFTVTDAKGCNATGSVTLNQPPALELLAAPGTILCAGGTTDVLLTARGGVAPYSITGETRGLKAGTHRFTVTDANGNATTTVIDIKEPLPLTLNAAAGEININGGTTSVLLSANGGTVPYVYSGQQTDVKAGQYSYTVTDANGCQASTMIIVTEPAPAAPPAPPAPTASLTATVQAKNITCSGLANGSATVSVTGGQSPYTYSWSNGANGASVNGLGAGSYEVTVRDANGLTTTAQVSISAPELLRLTASSGTINFYGGSTQVTLQASGGTAPYLYSGNLATVTAGIYTYTVTDANGCTAVATLTITQPDPMILKASAGTIKCFGGTADVRLSVEGGRPPYTFSGDTLNLRAGTYSFSATDVLGNKATIAVELKDPEKLELIASPGQIKKIGGVTDVELNAKGGTLPYLYGGLTTGVKAGNYQYEVTDANNCKATASVEVREPAVRLTSFEVAKGDTAVSLKWATSYEYAIDHFEIERSTDNANFQSISKTTSLWSSLRLANYLVTDGRPMPTRNYYRIVAVTSFGERILLDEKDLFYDGRSKIAVRNMTKQLDITLENQHMEDIQVTLYDMNGRPLKTSRFNKQTYLWNIKFNMEGLPNGSYIISINSAHVKHSKQVIKL